MTESTVMTTDAPVIRVRTAPEPVDEIRKRKGRGRPRTVPITDDQIGDICVEVYRRDFDGNDAASLERRIGPEKFREYSLSHRKSVTRQIRVMLDQGWKPPYPLMEE